MIPKPPNVFFLWKKYGPLDIGDKNEKLVDVTNASKFVFVATVRVKKNSIRSKQFLKI
jgi:hypothetical protein